MFESVTFQENLPPVLHERLVSCFRFWDKGIQEGISYNNGLYRLAWEFELSDRSKAYQVACNLAEQNVPAVITVSPRRYGIWISLAAQSGTEFPGLNRESNRKQSTPLTSQDSLFEAAQNWNDSFNPAWSAMGYAL